MPTSPGTKPAAPRRWSESAFVDDNVVEHRRHMGDVVVPGERPLFVDIVQRDELDPSTTPPTVTRSTVQMSVTGVRIDAQLGRDLARLLTDTANEMDLTTP